MTSGRAGAGRQHRRQSTTGKDRRPTPPAAAVPAGGGRGADGAWSRLATAVAEALAVLDADQCLVLNSKRRGYFVQLVVLDDGGVHAEAVSNEWLRPKHTLDAACARRLAELGWSEPTLTRAEVEAAEEAGKEAEPPEGSTNYSRNWSGRAPFREVAELAVATLREVYGIRRTEQLAYVAFAPGPREILLPTLGIANLPVFEDDEEEEEDDEHVHAGDLLRPENAEELREAVVEALRSFTDLEDPTVDEDGDIPLRYGSALIILRVDDEAPFVGLVSPLLTGVPTSPEVHEALNELTRSHRQVRFYHATGTVHAAMDLIADPFVPDHLGSALAVMGTLCDETGRELQHRLGGTKAFEVGPGTRPKRRKARYN
jgi:hypothetical protein